jgi:hypothetical protein
MAKHVVIYLGLGQLQIWKLEPKASPSSRVLGRWVHRVSGRNKAAKSKDNFINFFLKLETYDGDLHKYSHFRTTRFEQVNFFIPKSTMLEMFSCRSHL